MAQHDLGVQEVLNGLGRRDRVAVGLQRAGQLVGIVALASSKCTLYVEKYARREQQYAGGS